MMKRILPATALLFALFGPARAEEFFPLDDVHRGMIGYALTVIEGTRIDTMTVEVIDVIRARSSSGSSILVEVRGLGTDISGIAGGMSGSPVYLEGKLAGALAFTYSGARIAIGGVTPIGEMVEVLERRDKEVANHTLQGRPASGSTGRPDRIATPIAISGFAGPVSDDIDRFFADLGMVTTLGGAGGGDSKAKGWEMRPGAAVGVRLLSGDANLTAIGTVTWVDGDRMVAFGHPLFQSGNAVFPLVSAEIHAVMPSRGLSFKIGSPIETVGAMTQDRRTAIAGELGMTAPTIPIRVGVTVPGIRKDEFTYEAIDHRALTAALAAWATTNSIMHNEKSWGDGTARVKTRIALHGTDQVLETDNVYTASTFIRAAAADVALPIQVFANTSIEDVAVKSIDVEVEVRDGRDLVRIEEVLVEKGSYRPGQEVKGKVLVRRYQGGVTEHPFSLPVPADQPAGELILRVCDAEGSEDFDDKRAPNRTRVTTLDGLISLLKDRRGNDRVYCTLYDRSIGATIEGRAFPNLPASVLSIYAEPRHADDAAYRTGRVIAATDLPFSGVVSGCWSLPVNIDPNAP